MYPIHNLFVLILFCLSCGTKKNKSQITNKQIYSISLTYKAPIGYQNNQPTYLQDSIRIHYYDKFVLYESFINNQTSFLTREGFVDTLKPNSTENRITSQYILTSINSDQAYEINASSLSRIKPVKLDSYFLRNPLIFSFKKLHDAKMANAILLKSITNGVNLTEVYIPKKKVNDTVADSSYYYYSNSEALDKINFSLYPDLDKEKGKRLIKHISIYNRTATHDKRELTIELNFCNNDAPRNVKNIFSNANDLITNNSAKNVPINKQL